MKTTCNLVRDGESAFICKPLILSVTIEGISQTTSGNNFILLNGSNRDVNLWSLEKVAGISVEAQHYSPKIVPSNRVLLKSIEVREVQFPSWGGIDSSGLCWKEISLNRVRSPIVAGSSLWSKACTKQILYLTKLLLQKNFSNCVQFAKTLGGNSARLQCDTSKYFNLARTSKPAKVK
jgi:hypothetical protein